MCGPAKATLVSRDRAVGDEAVRAATEALATRRETFEKEQQEANEALTKAADELAEADAAMLAAEVEVLRAEKF